MLVVDRGGSMQSRYSNSLPEQPVNSDELRRKWAQALDRNRNQRQALTLLMHYSTILQQDSALSRRQSARKRVSWPAETQRRTARSFAALARIEDALEEWRFPPQLFREL